MVQTPEAYKSQLMRGIERRINAIGRLIAEVQAVPVKTTQIQINRLHELKQGLKNRVNNIQGIIYDAEKDK